MLQNIKIFGIEIKDNETFSEELTIELKQKFNLTKENIYKTIRIKEAFPYLSQENKENPYIIMVFLKIS